MADRVVLHIGLMKSGTSYVQQRLLRSKAAVEDQGFLFPGPRWGNQVIAVAEFLGRRRRPPGAYPGAWDALVAEVAASERTAIISMEFLAPIGVKKISAVVEAFAPTPVEVVVTARDLARTIPAMWQESLKNSGSWTFAEYLQAIQDGTGPGAQFWREQALGAVLVRWSEVVGGEHVTVVTVPPPDADRGLLWTRFCEAIGLSPDAAADIPPINESLGAASASVLRQVNAGLASYDISWPDYSDVVKFGLGKAVLRKHRRAEATLGMPVDPWLRDRSAAMRERVSRLPVRVVGDLADLEPRPVSGADPDAVDPREQLEAAVMALTELVKRDIVARSGPLQPRTGDDPDGVEGDEG